jgi:nucleoside-diphosphate-sugar epimerase
VNCTAPYSTGCTAYRPSGCATSTSSGRARIRRVSTPRAAPAAASGHIFNVACADRITIADLCAKIRGLVGAEIEPQHGPARSGDVRHSQADISLAAELMDYAPQIALDDGLDVTVQWYRQVTV